MMEKKTVAILGMMCAGCSANVERKLNSISGVASATVNLPARTALIEYDPRAVSLKQMKDSMYITTKKIIFSQCYHLCVYYTIVFRGRIDGKFIRKPLR